MLKPKIKKLKLSTLNPAAYNPRTISHDAVDGLTKSLERFGCVEPIIVNIRDGRNVIVGGHQRHTILLDKNVKEMDCVVVDLSEKDERLLNLALNNPHTQGKFINEITAYIDALQADMGDDNTLLDLKIQALKNEIHASDGLTYKEQNLKPYKKCHVLLSFPPQLLGEVANAIEPLLKIEEIEYEQGAN